MARCWVSIHELHFQTYLAHEADPDFAFIDAVMEDHEEPNALHDLYEMSGPRVREGISAMRKI